MIFEVGKYYEHITGAQLFICAVTNETHIYNNGLIAMNGLHLFIGSKYNNSSTVNEPFTIVGKTSEHTVGYTEINKEQFKPVFELNSNISYENKYEICKCYELNVNSFYVINKFEYNGTLLTFYENNSYWKFGNDRLFTFELDVIKDNIKDFIEITWGKFMLINHLYNNDNEKLRYERDIKMDKLKKLG